MKNLRSHFGRLVLAWAVVHGQSSIGLAQGQANNWYFGANAGLTFSTSPPQALTDGQLSTFEGCVTISNKSGNLLFYTDGITVWNRNHAVMPNGTALKGHPSASQSGVVVPKPGDPDRYYIFTVPEGPKTDPQATFHYSEVDMTLEGGLGDVASGNKNTPLFNGSSEKIAVASHKNGLWYWVIAHQYATGAYYAYLVDCDGINLSKSVLAQTVGSPQSGENSWIGYLVASPDGTKVAAAHSESAAFELFDFDNATGTLANRVQLDVPANEAPYGVAFSPNNTVLYGSIWRGSTQGIHQWHLADPDIPGSRYLIDSGLTGAVQLGPDGKLYVAQPTTAKLGAINNPNVPGDGCNYVKSQVDLDGRICQYGLPPFVSSFFAPPKKIKIDPPYGAGSDLPFSIEGAVIYTSILWDFGDGATSTEDSPKHAYAADGSYPVTVTLYGSNCGQDETLYTTVIIGTPDDLTTSADATICINDGTAISASGGNGFGYTWDNSLGAGAGHTVSPATTTTYTVTTKVRTGTDLITNGNFEQGSVGFTSQYNQTSSGPGSLSVESSFGSCMDHTHQGGQMLVIDPASGSGNVPTGTDFWCQTVDVEQDRDYGFSAWILGSQNPALQVAVNGTPIAETYALDGNDICWPREMLAVWHSGTASKAQVCLSETAGAGIQFAIDDIKFYPLANVSKSVTVKVITVPTVPAFSMETIFCLNSPAPPLPTVSDNGIPGTWLPAAVNTAVPRARTHTFTPAPGECAVPLDQEIHVDGIDPGAITGNQTICSDGGSAGLIGSLADAESKLSEDPNAFAYSWEYSTDDGNTWTAIPGANGSSYQPGNLTQTTEFRRIVATPIAYGNCPPIASKNTVKVTVKNGAECKTYIGKDVRDDSKNGLAEAGEILTYTIRVTNTQNYGKTIKTITDPIPTGTDYVPNSADKGGAEIIENGIRKIVWENVNVPANSSVAVSFQVWVTDNLTGLDWIHNKATLARDPDPSDTSTGDEVDVDIPTSPKWELKPGKAVSDASGDDKAQANELLTYTIRLENTGDGDMENVSASDAVPLGTAYRSGSASHGGTETNGMLDWTGITVPFGQTVDLTFQVWVTDDLTGIDSIRNTATVYAPKMENMTVTANIPADPVVHLSLTKEADRTNSHQLGALIPYVITVTNTGSVSLSGIAVTDDKADQQHVGTVAKLAPGEHAAFTATHKVTQPDVDAGQVDNLARATAYDPYGNAVAAESADPAPCPNCDPVPGCPTCTSVPIPQHTGMSVTKAVVNKQTTYEIYETVGYDITVTNTGNVTLADIKVTDADADDTNLGYIATLAPGQSEHFPATHIVAQADVDAGKFLNIALAEGWDPSGKAVTKESTDPDCMSCTSPGTTVPVGQGAGAKMALEKKADRTKAYDKAGDVIAYTITVTNTGKLTLTDIEVTDNNADSPNLGKIATLAPGHSEDFPATHKVTPADMDAGHVLNTARAEGRDPAGNLLTAESTDPDCTTCTGPGTTVTLVQKPTIVLTKTVTSAEPYLFGDLIAYNITVTNTGNVTLTGIAVSDGNADAPGNHWTVGTLAPNASASFLATHTVMQPDVDAGQVLNIALAEGRDPIGNLVTAESTDPACTACTGPGTTVPIFQKPEMTVTKAVLNRKTAYLPGEVVEYRITVTNTGNMDLTGIEVTDDNADVRLLGTIGKLPMGATEVFTARHTVSPAEMERGQVLNIALAEGRDPSGNAVTAESVNPELLASDPADLSCPSCTVISIWAPIEAVADSYEITRLQDRQTEGSVLDNDLLDGSPVSPSRFILTPLATDHPGMLMGADGVVRVPGSIVPGRYRYAYQICEAANPRNCSESEAVIDVLPDRRRPQIPNVFTPNGDGKNDTFEIVGIDGFDRLNLEVMDRFGNQLYRSEDYQNEWDGGDLKDGTYFYIIGLHKGETLRTIKGWVTIIREFLTY